MAGSLLLALSAGLLAGCGSGFSLRKAEVDRSLYTSAISSDNAASADPGRLSDQATIRNAVTSIDPEGIKGQPLPWANTDTGSRGTISNIVEYQADGSLCRRFQASRESFDGVNLFDGEACRSGEGLWQLRAFDPQ